MSNSGERLQYLSHKYIRFFDGNNDFNVPDRLKYKKLENEEFYNEYMLKSRSTVIEDNELRELLSLIRPKEAQLVSNLLDQNYRALPKACKFSNRLFLNEKINLYYHGESSNETISSDFGVTFLNHKFVSFIPSPGFDYQYYESYIRSSYYLDNKIPRCYINGNSNKSDTLTDNPMYYNTPNWQCSIEDLWDFFKLAKCGKPPDVFKHCSTIAKDIENGIPHCFSFGQFILLFPMLRNMKFSKPEDKFHLLNPSKLFDHVYVAKLSCCFNCPLTYNITIDFKHRLVLILVTGKHLNGCLDYQRKKGFLVIKDLFNLSSDPVLCKDIASFGFDMSILKYYGFDDIDLYYKPSLDKCHLLELGSSIKSDLNQLVKLIDTGMEYYNRFQSPVPLYINEEIITHSFTVNGCKSFIMGSKIGLTKLAEQICFNVDFIDEFAMKDLKLITIPFNDIKSNNSTIGCITLLQGKITSLFLKEFIISLKELINKISESAFVNLKYIVTKDSSIFYDAFKEGFSGIKVIKDITPSVEKAFPKLDKIEKKIMAEAAVELNPMKFYEIINSLILYRQLCYKEMMFIIRNKNLELSIFSNIPKRKFESELLENRRKFQQADELRKNIMNIQIARDFHYFWASSTRCIFPEYEVEKCLYQADSINDQIMNREKIVNTKCELGVVKQLVLHKLYGRTHEDAMQEFSIYSGCRNNKYAKDIGLNLKSIYKDYGNFDIIKKNGFSTFTNKINDSIEFEINLHVTEKEKKSLDVIEVFYIMQTYILNKVKEQKTISTMEPNLYKYPFIKCMNNHQKTEFYKVMNLFKFKNTEYSCQNMESFNLCVDFESCGCARRCLTCIPCEHMLYKIHLECTSNIKRNTNLIIDSKEYNAAIQKLFDKELFQHSAFYETFIERTDEFDKVDDITLRNTFAQICLGEHGLNASLYQVPIYFDFGEGFKQQLTHVLNKYINDKDASKEVLTLPIAEKSVHILSYLTEAFESVKEDKEGYIFGRVKG